MKIAIIGGINKSKVTYESQRLLQEGLKMGHETVYLGKYNILTTNFNGNLEIFFKSPKKDNQVTKSNDFNVDVKPVKIYPNSIKYGANITGLKNWFSIKYFDAIIIRERGRNQEWANIFAKYLQKNNIKFLDNSLATDKGFSTKLGNFALYSQNNINYPKTIYLNSHLNRQKILNILPFPIIVKTNTGSKGLEVFKFNNKKEVKEFFLNNRQIKTRNCLFQEYINFKGDIRVFTVGEKILGAMHRIPQNGNWKGNVAQGALTKVFEITPAIKNTVQEVIKQEGNKEILGIDIMLKGDQPFVIETNPVPQFKGFEDCTKINVAKEIIECLVNL